MSYPIVEKIAQAIETALEAVTTANGYQVDVAEVVRPKTRGIDRVPAHGGIVLVQEESTSDDNYSAVGNPPAVGKKVTFYVAVIIRISESSDQSFDQASNYFVADITKALMADVHWDGLAIDSKIGVEQPMMAEDNSFEGTAIPFEVIYRTKENDPYTQV